MKNTRSLTIRKTTKFLSLLLLISFLFTSACSKDEDQDPIETIQMGICEHDENEEVFTVVEQMPRFPGCENTGLSNPDLKNCADAKMLEFVYDNLEYPTAALNNNIEGTAVIRFIVEANGCISNPEILKNLDFGTGEEALRVVTLMPTWIPGKQRGEPVAVYFNLPVRFRL